MYIKNIKAVVNDKFAPNLAKCLTLLNGKSKSPLTVSFQYSYELIPMCVSTCCFQKNATVSSDRWGPEEGQPLVVFHTYTKSTQFKIIPSSKHR